MPTLDELIAEHTKDGKRPDDIRVRQSDWRPEAWFRPYFKSRWWYGLNQDGTQRSFTAVEEDFELYTEPKPKVKRAQYLVHIKGYDPYITDILHTDEKSVQLRNLTVNPFILCERLMETEREFDE